MPARMIRCLCASASSPVIVAGVDLANMRRVWTFALVRIVAVTRNHCCVSSSAPERRHCRTAARSSSGAPLFQRPNIRAPSSSGSIPSRAACSANEPAELGHFLLEPPEHHIRAVAHPRRRHLRRLGPPYADLRDPGRGSRTQTPPARSDPGPAAPDLAGTSESMAASGRGYRAVKSRRESRNARARVALQVEPCPSPNTQS